METENDVVAVNGSSMTASAGSESTKSDGLLSQDQQELCERVAHLEKRVREQEDEIVCLKGALADVLRRIGQVESVRTQNSLLPSKPLVKTPRKAPLGQERPKSTHYESSTPRPSSQQSARQRPRGSSSSGMSKKWSSMEKNIEGTNGHSSPRHNTSQLTHSKRSSSHGNLPLKLSVAQAAKGGKDRSEPTYDQEDKYVRMYLRGRPVPLYAPSKTEDYDVRAPQDSPDAELKLEWVYGYRGRDARNNLYNLSGEAVYFSGEVIVLHNFEQNTQRHYLGHTDDVKCIAIHPDQTKVASGQVAGHEKKEGKNMRQKPHVRVWDSVSLNTYYVIGEGDFARGVCCLSFSKMDGGKHLLAVDEGNDHTLSIWDTSRDNRAKKLCDTRSSESIVTQCEFHPYMDKQIVCCGKNQITFWTFDGNSLAKKAGIFEGREKPKVMICFAFSDNGDVVTGDSSGHIYVWGKGTNKISHAILNAHVGGVFSLCVTNDGYMLSGGGKDRRICQWDSNYEKTGLECEIPERFGAVRMISRGQGNMLLVGTIRNCVLQGTMELQFSPVVEGHKEELWGLCPRPGLQQFLTCGSDRHIYCWDSQLHACVWMKEVSDPAHCISIHPHADIAAIGCDTKRWFALDLSNHEILAVFEDANEQIECISFSPDGTMLAVGSRDNNIYVYNVEEEGRKFSKRSGKCSGHSSYITHIDWSENSEIIRSNSGDYEVLYWIASRCKQETNKEIVRDLEWATQNCTLSFDSIGIWPDGADGTDVNSCAKSNDGTLIASADDFGKVNLLVYPSVQPRAVGHAYGGHSSHVTNACFLTGDTHVISTGGRDMTVLQFQVVRGCKHN